MTLNVSLLGRFSVDDGAEALHVPSKRGRALLAALALAPDLRLSRQAAAALLWPDRDETQARASLRQELSTLRKSLGPVADDILLSDADSISIARNSAMTCDIWNLIAADAAADGSIELPTATLLDDIDLPLEPFEEWLTEQRRVLRARLVAFAERHLAARIDRGDWAAVEDCAQRLMQIDPLNETAVAALMRSAAANGHRLQALAAFDEFSRRLRADLDVGAGPELLALREEIASGAPAVTATAPAAEIKSLFDRPAVLVTGFDCLTASEEDRMLATGMAEELRTTLSYWRWFPVIGPEAIGWKTGRSADIRAIARQVSASYAVTGSLRRHGDRARITVSLIDTQSGQSIWSQNFDGDLADIFAFQEDVSRSIVAQIEPQIAHAEAVRITRSPPAGLAAWHLVAQADEIDRLGGTGYGTPESNDAQLPLLEEATRREPGYARAWTRLAKIHWRHFIMGWDADRDSRAALSEEASQKAISLDPDDWQAHSYQALIQVFARKNYQAGEYHASEAVRLNPSAAHARHAAACTLEWLGRPEEALEHLELIFRLDPDPNAKAAIFGDMATCHLLAGHLESSVEVAEKLMAVAPDYSRGLQRCAATFGHAGRDDLAAQAVDRLRALHPDFSEDYVRSTYPFSQSGDLDYFIEGLRKAGCWG